MSDSQDRTSLNSLKRAPIGGSIVVQLQDKSYQVYDVLSRTGTRGREGGTSFVLQSKANGKNYRVTVNNALPAEFVWVRRVSSGEHNTKPEGEPGTPVLEEVVSE